MNKAELLNVSRQTSGDENLKRLISDVDRLLGKEAKDIELLFLRASLHQRIQLLGKAINDYQRILTLEPENQKAKVQRDSLQSILHYNNTDIYASPNTNFDPWLD